MRSRRALRRGAMVHVVLRNLWQPARIAGQIRLDAARQQPNRGRLLGASLVALKAQQRVLFQRCACPGAIILKTQGFL